MTRKLRILTDPLQSRNMKNLSLALPRRPSIVSLPAVSAPTPASMLYRKEEDSSPTIPYPDGPIQIIPGIWLGSEDNARDWKGLIERGIKSILNVAKEVASPLDPLGFSYPLRAVASAPNFQSSRSPSTSTYHPPNFATGRPAMHYLKLQWSHGQQDLVDVGFHDAMSFTDAALERGEGVLIHCQCGISRSATMVIALVMRAAAQQSSSVPPEVWALKGYQGAYAYVKGKSRWIGPNMSLIYQLLEYEKKLKGSDDPVSTDEEEEWGRRRRMLDETPSDTDPEEQESTVVMREAEALDKAMEDRIVARKSSASSLASTGSGVGMGAAWRSRYASTRKRAESVASNKTNGSIISEDLVEEDEEEELLGIGGGFDEEERRRSISADTEYSSASNSPDDDPDRPTVTVTRAPVMNPPPSAPVWKTSFGPLPPAPATAIRSTFNLPTVKSKSKRRPPPIAVLPPVPSSPVVPVELTQPSSKPPICRASTTPNPTRPRIESKKLAPPPLYIRNSLLRSSSANADSSFVSTPSQTLFVFPPSPTSTRTPSTMTITGASVPFPSLSTPRVSTFRSHGRTRSFIGLGATPTPTTAFTKVDVRGYVAIE